MPTTSDELAYARSWIGKLEADQAFNDRFDRLLQSFDSREDALNAAIEEAIRARIAVLSMDTPSQMSIQGISVGFAGNLSALKDRLESFQSKYGSSAMTVTELERPDPR